MVPQRLRNNQINTAYISRDLFPKCLFYDNENKNYIYNIHGEYLRIKRDDYHFRITERFIREEWLYKKVFRQFLEDALKFNYKDLDSKCIFGNIWENIINLNMDKTTKSYANLISEIDLFN